MEARWRGRESTARSTPGGSRGVDQITLGSGSPSSAGTPVREAGLPVGEELGGSKRTVAGDDADCSVPLGGLRNDLYLSLCRALAQRQSRGSP